MAKNGNNNIVAVRKKKGVKQKELARKIGVTPSLVSQWEKGARNPTLDSLVRIAAALDCDVRDLISDDQRVVALINKQEEPPAPNYYPNSYFTETSDLKALIIQQLDLLNDNGKQKVYDYTRDLSRLPDYSNGGKQYLHASIKGQQKKQSGQYWDLAAKKSQKKDGE